MATESLLSRSGYLRRKLALANLASVSSSTSSYQRLHTKPPRQILAQDLASLSHHAVKSLASTSLPAATSLKTPTSGPSATSHLSFWALLQTYLITACTSSPLVIAPSIRILSAIAYSKSALLSPDRNPVLHWLLKNTIYRQFCAGENAVEVQSTIARLKETGIKGIILCYAREVEVRGDEGGQTAVQDNEAIAKEEIDSWAQGVKNTIKIVPEGNFVSIKFSGAGSLTLKHLQHRLPPPPLLANHLHEICSLAHSRKIRLCIDAEQSTFQAGIDAWTLDLSQKFNSATSSIVGAEPWACIYNTYQTYLISSPQTLSKHLTLAKEGNFILGAKLVRGAYLASEPRSLFWPTKESTDKCFNALAKGLITKSRTPIEELITTTYNNSASKSTTGSFPPVALVLATHNLPSTRAALHLRRNQAEHGQDRIEMVYAQLQGMADHVTGELVGAARAAEAESSARLQAHEYAQAQAYADTASGLANSASSASSLSPVYSSTVGGTAHETSNAHESPIDVPHVCKYLTWGTVGECSKYLVRRAEENRDAVARTVEARKALGAEVFRRMRAVVGL